MTQRTNVLGQPVGNPVPDWTARPRPPRTPMQGRLCRLEPLVAARHAAALYAAYAADVEGRNRDTAWLSIVDDEWPTLRAAFERWLDVANFDTAGVQRASLRALNERPAT